MNKFKKILPFIGELNQANHPEYHKTLDFLPTLRSEIEQALERKARSVHTADHSALPLPTNDSIISETELERYEKRLIDSLERQFIFS